MTMCRLHQSPALKLSLVFSVLLLSRMPMPAQSCHCLTVSVVASTTPPGSSCSGAVSGTFNVTHSYNLSCYPNYSFADELIGQACCSMGIQCDPEFTNEDVKWAPGTPLGYYYFQAQVRHQIPDTLYGSAPGMRPDDGPHRGGARRPRACGCTRHDCTLLRFPVPLPPELRSDSRLQPTRGRACNPQTWESRYCLYTPTLTSRPLPSNPKLQS
jgi:hypothetical protein